MNQYWVDINGDNESFWEHEWNKHGTCMSTIRPTCLPSGSTTGADAAYYFQRAVDTFQSLPTYQYLSAAGITPSTSNTYTYMTLANAIKASTGYTPALDCSSTTLNQVSYYFNLKGSLIDGTLVPIDLVIRRSFIGILPQLWDQIPSQIWWLNWYDDDNEFLSDGDCGSFEVHNHSHNFKWKLRRVPVVLWDLEHPDVCDIDRNDVRSVTTASVFTVTSSGGSLLLTYSGSTAFTADSIPSGTTQVTLYAASARAQDVTLIMHAV
ncbi:ribonuclease T2-like [Tulasnella sp. 417]|nr:ribonuclease T2-like [Tulasnella sp. 417]